MVHLVAVEVPAGTKKCPLSCIGCRTDRHTLGDIPAVVATVRHYLPITDEYHVTAAIETGIADGFDPVIQVLKEAEKPFSTLGATKASVVRGSTHFQASLWAHREGDPFDHSAALRAIDEAHRLDVPVVLSVPDDGRHEDRLIRNVIEQPDRAMDRYGAHGTIIRPMDGNGAAIIHLRPGRHIGIVDHGAYREGQARKTSVPTTCVGVFGKRVRYLGMSPRELLAA
jgi:hypothetical protein